MHSPLSSLSLEGGVEAVNALRSAPFKIIDVRCHHATQCKAESNYALRFSIFVVSLTRVMLKPPCQNHKIHFLKTNMTANEGHIIDSPAKVSDQGRKNSDTASDNQPSTCINIHLSCQSYQTPSCYDVIHNWLPECTATATL
jgi:hypothetical protein